MYELYQEQLLHAGREELWEFISHPANLNEITPPELQFSIISDVPDQMYDGLLVEYQVSLPLLGKTEWVSEIKHIIPGRQFVDEQKIGPYRLWYHLHRLQPVEHGIRMIDRVSYRPPYGVIGSLANRLFLRSQLEKIFNYRYRVLDRMFNRPEETIAASG